MMIEENLARVRAHRNNIQRYRGCWRRNFPTWSARILHVALRKNEPHARRCFKPRFP
jgi:hypothetical protein